MVLEDNLLWRLLFEWSSPAVRSPYYHYGAGHLPMADYPTQLPYLSLVLTNP